MKPTQASDNDAKPKSFKDSIFSSTPVVLTVIATVLAGLSSSEMTKSQYHRATAAQNQAKASDQWSYYQAKRLRAVEAGNTLDLLSASSRPAVPDSAEIEKASANVVDSVSNIPAISERIGLMNNELQSLLSDPGKLESAAAFPTHLPVVSEKSIGDENILHAMDAADRGATDAQMTPLLKQISEDALTQAMKTANDNLTAFDAAIEPAGTILERLHAILSQETALAAGVQRQGGNLESMVAGIQAVQTDVAAARLRFSAARYDKEAGYNRVIGQLLEVQVHLSGMESDRAKKRSTDFFLGMLTAQMGVVISTFSLALHRRSAFWAMAATAGMLALAFSGYVYLFI